VKRYKFLHLYEGASCGKKRVLSGEIRNINTVNPWVVRAGREKKKKLGKKKERKSEILFPALRDKQNKLAFLKVSISCPSDQNIIKMKMSIEDWWNDAEGGKL
jgi:hypothetical protein